MKTATKWKERAKRDRLNREAIRKWQRKVLALLEEIDPEVK